MSAATATLLIVDDDEGIRKLLEILLEDQGYHTLSACSGEEALTLVAKHLPDLILLDAMMPGLNGYQVARQLKANLATANIPIIILSGRSEPGARLAGLEAGAEEVLTKPVVNDELWLRVRNLLRLKAFTDNQNAHTLTLEQQLQQRTHDLESFRSALGADDRLLNMANTPLTPAKEAGADAYRFYTAPMNVQVQARRALETALREAVRLQSFELHYQPKINLADGTVSGVEALLRWHRPGLPAVSPAVFIPILEDMGLICSVGRWVIERVCKQIAHWQRSGEGAAQVAVNVSAHQIADGDLVDDIRRSLDKYHIEPKWLELELTESSLMINTPQTISSLLALRDIGLKIAIDDFGTGYSSLAYLSRFPIDKLKIDIAFIREVPQNLQDAAITRTIIELAHSLNLQVIAEGVETCEQLEFLTKNGCDQVQGYLFSRPLPTTELESLLREQKCFT